MRPEDLIRFGLVTGVSPLMVRFAGDTGDSSVGQNTDITLTEGDRVVCFKVGARWVVGFVYQDA